MPRGIESPWSCKARTWMVHYLNTNLRKKEANKREGEECGRREGWIKLDKRKLSDKRFSNGIPLGVLLRGTAIESAVGRNWNASKRGMRCVLFSRETSFCDTAILRARYLYMAESVESMENLRRPLDFFFLLIHVLALCLNGGSK